MSVGVSSRHLYVMVHILALGPRCLKESGTGEAWVHIRILTLREVSATCAWPPCAPWCEVQIQALQQFGAIPPVPQPVLCICCAAFILLLEGDANEVQMQTVQESLAGCGPLLGSGLCSLTSVMSSKP